MKPMLLCTLTIALSVLSAQVVPGDPGPVPNPPACGTVEPQMSGASGIGNWPTPAPPNIGVLHVTVNRAQRSIVAKFVSSIATTFVEYGARYTMLNEGFVHQLKVVCAPLHIGKQIFIMEGKYKHPSWGDRYRIEFYVKTPAGTRTVTATADLSDNSNTPSPQPGVGSITLTGNFPSEPTVYAEGVGPVPSEKVTFSPYSMTVHVDPSKTTSLAVCVKGACSTYPIAKR